MPKETSKSGRSGKSNKTARVMNLLIDPEAAAENGTAPGGGAASGASAPAAGAIRTANDENTQEQIRSALETELTGFAAPAAQEPAVEPEAAPVAEQVQTPPPQPAAAPAPAITPEPPAQDASAVQEQPAAQQEAPQPEPAPSVQEKPAEDEDEDNDDDYICFNVTQALVEDKADKYMNMFGMCTCNRCRIDVISLALSNLPAKYVVARPKDMIPRLSMYESKYSAAVITQVMKACTKVIELPHHKR